MGLFLLQSALANIRFGFDHHQLHPRQLGNCVNPCAWAAAAATCSPSDVSCFCNVILSAGSQVPDCINCIRPMNASLASQLTEAVQVCGGSLSSVANPGSTGITTGNPTSCSSQCAGIATAVKSCGDERCLCPTLIAQGSACSACFATVNVTEASLLSVAISRCRTVPTVSVARPTECSSQCGLVYIAATSCTDNRCFCPTFLAQGPECSSCWATVNKTEASNIGSILTACQKEVYPTKTTTDLTVSILSTSTATSLSSAGGGFGIGYGTTRMYVVILLAFVAGFLVIFG